MIPAHLQNRSLEQLRSTQETIRCFLVTPTGEGYESAIVTEEGQCVNGFTYHRSEKIIRRFPLGLNDAYPPDWAKDRTPLPYCSRCGNHDFSPEALKKVSGSKGRVWERVDTGERADNLNDFGPGAMWYITWYDQHDILCRKCNTAYSPDTKDEFEWIEESARHIRPTGDDAEYLHTPCGSGTFKVNIGYWYPGFDTRNPVPPLCVRTPGGDWVIDSRCSNCGSPQDSTHRCWPRRGVAPNITVDKSFGNTCSAGGGSIICGNYHGFLRDGYLVKC